MTQALQLLQSVASERNTLPILANIMITASEENGIEMAASDLEVAIRMKVDGVVEQPGSITVLASKLANIVKDLPPEEIRMLTTSNDRIELECGRGKYRIVGMDSEEFPVMPTPESDDHIQLNGDVFRGVLSKTEFAASTEEVRYFLNGIFFNFRDELTDVVATDGRQLALAHFDAMTPPEGVTGFIVPLKAVKELSKTFADSDLVNIALLENVILFSDDRSVLSTRKIDGDYPKYNKIIPADSELEGGFVMNRKELLRAVTRVSHLSNPKNYSICFDIKQDEEFMVVSTRTPELGDAEENVPITSCTKDIRIGFDSRLVLEALNHTDAESIHLGYSENLNPMVLRPRDESGHIILLMPMRIS